MPEEAVTQLALPGLAPGGDSAATSWRIGDRVQLSPGSATGTIERLRGDIAEVLWDTGAGCPVPFAWLGEPTDRLKREEAAATRERRHTSTEWERAHRARKCRGCGQLFRPRRADHVFCTPSCRKRTHRRGSAPGSTQAVASRDIERFGPATAVRLCANCGEVLTAARSDARYCGATCRRAAHRERERAGQ